MIRFETVNGLLKPLLPADATSVEVDAANTIAQRLNGIQGPENYKMLMQSLDQTLQGNNILGQAPQNNVDARSFIDNETIAAIENFYVTATGLTPWDSTKQGVPLDTFDPAFYSKQVPGEVQTWNNAATAVSFAGRSIPDIEITKKYPTLDSFLHADYTFVGSPSGRLGKPKPLDQYTETLRPPTDTERQILRETILGVSPTNPQSLAELATQSYVDTQGEQVFGALSANALKDTVDEYSRALKQQEMAGMLEGMGMPSVSNIKQDIKNAVLGDIGAGGYMGFGANSGLGKSLSSSLDRSLGIGSSVQYNWQQWFDQTLAARYQALSQVTDPADAAKVYAVEQQFANSFVQDYLKPRFDTSKSIAEFISYMDVKSDEQNVLQTQLVSSALKDFANKQAQTYINDLGATATQKQFDPNFYWNPELITGTDVQGKQALYQEQKASVQNDWNNRNSTQAVVDGKTWGQLAYEYGVDLENQSDFARLHYAVIGKTKNYDPVADTYTRQDLASFIQGPLAEALQSQKASFGNPAFLDFVSAEQKAQGLVNQLNLSNLPQNLKSQLADLGYDPNSDPAETIKTALMGILSTDPAFAIREQIRQLNEQRIKPTQEQLGFGYIQRDTDEQTVSPAGGSALFKTFQKAGYSGTENQFYTDFFPDATPQDKSSMATDVTKARTGKGVQELLGFSLPDFSDPFAAMGSLDKMLSSDTIEEKQAYNPTRSKYFDFFPDEQDEGAPSIFGGSGTGSLFGY